MKTLLGALAAMTLAFPTWAKGDYCGAVLTPDDLVGVYILRIGDFTFGQMGLIYPDTRLTSVDIVNDNFGLAIVAEQRNAQGRVTGGMRIDLQIVANNGAPWNWASSQSMKHVFSPEFAQLVGCSVDRLPRLVGKGRSRSSEGAPIDFVYQLVPVARSSGGAPDMFGLLEWDGGGLTVQRPVSFDADAAY